MNTHRFQSEAAAAGEVRFGIGVARLLSSGTLGLHADVQERLRFAREQAVLRARVQHAPAVKAKPAWSVLLNGPGLTLSGPPSWWQRALAMAPLAVLVGGLVLVQHASQRELVLAAAEVDAVLLGDSLPPNAYSDPGFTEYLRSPEP